MTKPKSERLILGNPTETMSEAMLRGIVDGLIDEDETLPFINPDPVEWINEHYRIPETDDGKLELGDYQEACLRHVLTRGDDGHFPYSIIVWSDIKKSAKSSVAAAVALWRAFNTPWGSIKIVANDLKQADSRVAFYIRRCIELNPAMKKIVRVKPSGYFMEFPNYARIEAIPVDPSGEAGGNDDMIVFSELWAANSEASQRLWCYDEETEILTENGWVDCWSFDDDTKVATYNPDNNKIEFHRPRSWFKERYQGEMHLYESKTFSECVTPDHRLYGLFCTGDMNYKYSHLKEGVMTSRELRESAYSSYYPKNAGIGFDGESPEYKLIPATGKKPALKIAWGDWCEYMGWWLSEGSVKRNNDIPYTARICQDKNAHPDEWEKIKSLHEKIFGKDGFFIVDNATSFNVHNSKLAGILAEYGDSLTKYIPKEIRQSKVEHLRRFMDAYIDGDGYIREHYQNRSISIVTGSKRLADGLLEIGLKLGYAVSFREVTQKNGRKGKKFGKILTSWRVLLEPPKNGGYNRQLEKRKNHWGVANYDGLVWCPSVPSGLIVVRRNGKVYVSGNTEMTLSPMKYGESFRWVETYAGFSGESPLLEQLYIQGVKKGKRIPWSRELDPPLQAYENKPAQMFCLWNDTPRLPWQTRDYYAQEAATLLPSEFERVHRNQWVTSSNQFVPIEWWDACRVRGDEIPPLREDEPVIVAVDAAVSGDSFAVIVVSGSEAGDKFYVRYSQAWKPPKGGKIDFSKPEQEIRRLVEEYNVVEVCYDEYQLADMAGRMRREMIARLYTFGQGKMRLLSDKTLYDVIRRRGIHHTGEPDLREHISNANAKTEKSWLRLVKRSDLLKIDLAVCLSMALYRAMHWQL